MRNKWEHVKLNLCTAKNTVILAMQQPAAWVDSEKETIICLWNFYSLLRPPGSSGQFQTNSHEITLVNLGGWFTIVKEQTNKRDICWQGKGGIVV